MEPLVPLDVVPHMWQQDQRKEALGHACVQVADKKAGCLVDGVGAPALRLSDCQHLGQTMASDPLCSTGYL